MTKNASGGRNNPVHLNIEKVSMNHITSGTLVPSSVNGDIAIEWEWSNFNPSQNPNPLTDYDKTLHDRAISKCIH